SYGEKAKPPVLVWLAALLCQTNFPQIALACIVGGSHFSCVSSRMRGSLRNLVSWKLLQRRCHVFDRGRTILRPDGPVGVAGDVVRHSLAYFDRSPDRQTNVSLVLYMLNPGQL